MERILCPELPTADRCPVGVIRWTDKSGSHEAEFCVSAPVPHQTPRNAEDFTSRAVRFAFESAYNLQYVILLDYLEMNGAESITFTEYKPLCF